MMHHSGTQERSRRSGLRLGPVHLCVLVWVWVSVGGALPASQESSRPIPVGQSAPPIVATGLDGIPVAVSFDRPTVLYVLTPACVWCVRNAANITELFRQRGSAYQFVGLSLRRDGLKEFLESTPHLFPVHVVSQRTIADYGFGTLPSTLVVERGVVVKKWNGAYNRSQPAVEAFFQVKLPGITGTAATSARLRPRDGLSGRQR